MSWINIFGSGLASGFALDALLRGQWLAATIQFLLALVNGVVALRYVQR